MPGSCHRVALLSLTSFLAWVTKALFLKMPGWARMKDRPRERLKSLGTTAKRGSPLSHQKCRNCFIHSSLLALRAGFPSLAGPQPSEEAEGADKTGWSSLTPARHAAGSGVGPGSLTEKGDWKSLPQSRALSDFNAPANHLGTLLKCRFWFSWSGEGPGILHF